MLINKAAVIIVNKLMKNCDESKYSIYVYNTENFIGQAVTIIIILLIGFRMASLLQMITFVLFLMVLRGQTGGYHAKTNLGCIVFSCLVSSVAIMFERFLIDKRSLFVIPFLIISVIYIAVHATINHVNLNFTEYEMKRLRKLSRYYLLIEVSLICLFSIARVFILAIPASLAVITVAASMILAKILKQEVRVNVKES